MNADQTWTSLQDAVGGTQNKTMPGYGEVPLDHFSSTCLYFGDALSSQLDDDAPVGLIHVSWLSVCKTNRVVGICTLPPLYPSPTLPPTHQPHFRAQTAWGGSMVEQWLTAEDVASCRGADIADHNSLLHNTNVLPYTSMSIEGWVWYQGENNVGGLHGNSGTSSQPSSGYACMATKLVSLWRKEWSKTPNTTSPTAPFGVVSLSAHDSEGAADMASFRWAQQGSYVSREGARGGGKGTKVSLRTTTLTTLSGNGAERGDAKHLSCARIRPPRPVER